MERSSEGKNYAAIGAVKATGNKSSYNYNDYTYSTGSNFYRLRMTDIDGSTQYSSIVFEAAQSKETAKVFPNPAKNRLSISLNNSTGTTFQLFDIAGRLVRSLKIADTNTELDITDLPVGLYQYRLLSNQLGLIQQGKVAKY